MDKEKIIKLKESLDEIKDEFYTFIINMEAEINNLSGIIEILQDDYNIEILEEDNGR